MKQYSNALVLTLLLMTGAATQLQAQGTAFTYQGRLSFNGSSAAGSYDLTFAVFATNATGSPLTLTATNSATAITNGLFSVPLDFGAGIFTGPGRWLEIGARTNGGGAFATLTPRQPLMPTPYAIFANTASNLSGTVPATQITGAVSPNLLPGFQGPYYETVGGGQGNVANNPFATMGGGYANTAGYLGVVGGGDNNTASGYYASVPGGANNVAGGQYSLAAGQRAKALHQGSFVWADSQAADFSSTTNDQLLIRAQNGVGIGTNVTAGNALTVAGNVMATAFSGSGAGLTNLNAGSLTGAISPLNIGEGTITSSKLAAGAAAANLAAGNQTAVPSGGIIMSVSGGYQEQNLFNAGYVKIGSLNLIPESWNTNLQTGPWDTGELIAARVGHTAVWTGTEMIVWGGIDGKYEDYFYNNGASYNPVTDSWMPMTTTNAPVARQGATAVWTGSKMIVWGGYTNFYDEVDQAVEFVELPTGGIYDPTANAWTAVSTNGSPLYSNGHTAVWTGTNMIVFGGVPFFGFGGGPVFSGGIYNPAKNTWSPMRSNTVAGMRYNHSAIWDGTNMIVWGGIVETPQGDEYYTNSGASYNPAANTWGTLASAGPLSPRELPTAIWTGSQMLVWGGDTGYAAMVYNDGAAYNPGAGTWTTLPTNNVPWREPRTRRSGQGMR